MFLMHIYMYSKIYTYTNNNTATGKHNTPAAAVCVSNLKRISDEVIWVREGKAEHPVYVLQNIDDTSNATLWIEWLSNGKRERIFKHQIIKNGLQSRKRQRPNYLSSRLETTAAASKNNTPNHKQKQSPVSKMSRGSNSQTSPTCAVDFPVDKNCEEDTLGNSHCNGSIAEDEKEGDMDGEEGSTDNFQQKKNASGDHPHTEHNALQITEVDELSPKEIEFEIGMSTGAFDPNKDNQGNAPQQQSEQQEGQQYQQHRDLHSHPQFMHHRRHHGSFGMPPMHYAHMPYQHHYPHHHPPYYPQYPAGYSGWQYPYHQQPILVPALLPMHPPVQQYPNQQPGYQHQQQQGGRSPQQMGAYNNNATTDSPAQQHMQVQQQKPEVDPNSWVAKVAASSTPSKEKESEPTLVDGTMLSGDVEIEPRSLAANNNSPLQERYTEDPGN